jgi:hypothetical protein
MNVATKRITKLSHDLRNIFTNTYGENAEMVRLCQDHSYPYLFNDKNPVLDILQDEFVGIFDWNSNHFFLSPCQAARVGIYCKLALPHLIALILKAQWERFIADVSDYSPGSVKDLGSILTDDALINRHIKDFKPDSSKILKLLRNNNYKTPSEIKYSQVDFLISDLLKSNRFLVENEQISQLYPEKEITEEIILSGIPESQREEFVRAKELWRHKSDELDQMLLNLERRKRLNLETENKYFRHFGDLEIEKVEYENRLNYYTIMLKMKLDKPGMSYRQLIKSARKKLLKIGNRKKELENKLSRSRNYIENMMFKSHITEVSCEYRRAYEAECTTLLRKLFRLLHSDTCPDYETLSGDKKTEINELWLELMKSTKGDLLSFSPSMLLYSYPDYQQLLSIYERACMILGKDPDAYDIGNRLDYMVRKGAPVIAILEFLKNETEQTELHLANLELIQADYTNEDQTRLYGNAMENVTVYTEKLRGDITLLQLRIKETKTRLSDQFKTGK